jgi:hypothetical protein
LLEIRAQHCPGAVDVYDLTRSPDYTFHKLRRISQRRVA